MKRAHNPKPREFFLMDIDLGRTKAPSIEFLNEDILRGGRLTFLFDDTNDRGFPYCSENPRLRFNSKRGPPVRDVEIFRPWLVSEHAKAVFQSIDPHAFAFLECEVLLTNGEPGPKHWFCDVARIADVIDEASTIATQKVDRFGRKFFSMLNARRIGVRTDVDVALHVFRPKYIEDYVVCDNVMRDACKAANVTGLRFRDVLNL